jgi:hypothetical protein
MGVERRGLTTEDTESTEGKKRREENESMSFVFFPVSSVFSVVKIHGVGFQTILA